MGVKDVVRRLPLVGPVAVYGSGLVRRLTFTGSKDYWEQRYRAGGTSGGGSFGHLAQFKADVLNSFVERHGVKSVLEFGSGDGRQLELARYPRYIGLDVSPTAIRECAARFAHDRTKSFLLYSSDAFVDPLGVVSAELTLSLDVIYHLVEDPVFETYMRHLFAASTRYVGIYSSDTTKIAPQPHVRHRKFSDWVASNAPDFRVLERVPNPHRGNDPTNESFADFVFYEKAR
jgi:hypothetical protein